MTLRRVLIAVFAGLLALFALASYMGEKPLARLSIDDGKAKDRARLVQELRSRGFLINLECSRNRASVSPLEWHRVNAELKETFTKLVASHCGDQTGLSAVTMIDAQSGKELASFGGFGYSVR